MTFAALFAQLTDANSFCKIGWPAVLGPVDQDGDTTVSAWTQTESTDYYLIGGMTKSDSFAERNDNTCSTKGCAYLTLWFKIGMTFNHRRIYSEATTVAALAHQSKTTAVVFMIIDGNKARYGLTFIKWTGLEPEFSRLVYTLNQEVDLFAVDPQQTIAILNQSRLHLIHNDPDQLTTTDYFVLLTNGNEVNSVYKYETRTSNAADILQGTPTRKYEIGQGYDANNII